MVPISRQPKDKIQAIIDSCTRQFPEFSERSRKRIRTYLKSCRRTRRHKTPLNESIPSPSAGVTSIPAAPATTGPDDPQQQSVCRPDADKISKSKELSSSSTTMTTTASAAALSTTASSSSSCSQPPASSSPPPLPPPLPTSSSGSNNTHEPLITCAQLSSTSSSYHLTSRLAEQILATACDNEYQNAQRVRQGLKPLYQESPASRSSSSSLYQHQQDHLSDVAGDQHLLKSGGKNSLRYATDTSSGIMTTIMSAHHQPTNGLFPSSSSSPHHPNDQQQISASSSSTAPFPTGASSGAAVHVLTPAVSAHTSTSSLLAALCQTRSDGESDGSLFFLDHAHHLT